MKKKNLLKCLALTSMLALSVGAVTSCGSQGPKGDKGDKGEKGETGAQGEKGETGAQGEKGETGDTGATGAQGEKGDTGAQGEKGDTGAQGEKGDPGADGKDGETVYPVIIVKKDTEGGTIETDVIDGKAGESYTLTFTPDDEGDIVTSLYINNEEVSFEDHPEVLEGKYYGVFTESVVVSAVFGNINSYGYSILEEYYEGLVDGDAQLVVRGDNATQIAANKKGSYYSEAVSKEVTAQEGEVDKVIAAFDEDEAIADKITAIKEAVADGKTAIKAKYDATVAAAKKVAKEKADKLYGDTRNVLFVEADKAAMKADCLAEIEACTTLQALTDVIDDAEGLEVKGKYTATEALRDKAFDYISNAVSNLPSVDAAIFTGKDEDGLEELKEALEPYGISIDELPSEIAEDYNEEISAAKTFEVYAAAPGTGSTETYKKGDPVLGYEGAKKVKASYDDLKTNLKDAILDSYKAEINSSKVLLTNDSRTALIATVDTAIGDWLSAYDPSLSSASILDYVNNVSNGSGTIAAMVDEATTPGLIGYIEERLESNSTYYTESFKNERLSKALTDVYSAWSDEISAIKKADPDYYNLVHVSEKDSKYTYYNCYTVSSGSTKLTVANPFYQSTTATQDDSTGDIKKDQNSKPTATTATISAGDKASTYEGAGITFSDTTVYNSSSDQITTYNVETMLAGLVKVEADGSVKAGKEAGYTGKLNALDSVAKIKKAGQAFKGIFETIYAGAMATFYTSEKTAISSLLPNSGDEGKKNEGYIGASAQVTVDKMFDSLLPHKVVGSNSTLDPSQYTVKKLANAAVTIKAKADNLLILDNALDAWVKAQSDTGILSKGKLSTDTLMWEKTLDLTNSESTINKVLNGSLSTEANIKAAVATLDDVYEEGVEAFAASCKQYITEMYTSLHNNAKTMTHAKKLETVYNQLLKVYGYDASSNTSTCMSDAAKAFDLKSYDSINAYYECFVWIMQGYANETWGGTRVVVSSISTKSITDANYAKVAFLAALSDNGVEVRGYVYKSSGPNTEYNSEAEAREAFANALKVTA